jgi:glycosyltransferase involved in cell wall biosynthesis
LALFVTHAATVGGAEVVLARYLEARAGEHEVLVLETGPTADFFRATGAAVEAVPVLDAVEGVTRRLSPVTAGVAGARTVAMLPSLVAAVRRSRQRVVVTNSMKAHVVVPPACRLTGRVVGSRLHDIVTSPDTSVTGRTMLRTAGRWTRSFAAVSRAAAEAAEAIGLSPVEFFYNGIELGEPRSVRASETLRLLVVSQLAAWKGVHHVLDAAAALVERDVRFSLDVVGDAIFGEKSHVEALRKRAHALGIDGHVRWHGFRDDPRPYFRSADVFVHLPERPDPLPTAVLEAQAWSLPVIATASGGIAEIVADGETGLLVTRPDDVSRVLEGIDTFSNAAIRARFGNAARRRVERLFSMDAYLRAFDEWLIRVERDDPPPEPARRWNGSDARRIADRRPL